MVLRGRCIVNAEKYPRAELILQAAQLARALRYGADAIDRFLDDLPELEIGTARRRLREIAISSVTRLVELEP